MAFPSERARWCAVRKGASPFRSLRFEGTNHAQETVGCPRDDAACGRLRLGAAATAAAADRPSRRRHRSWCSSIGIARTCRAGGPDHRAGSRCVQVARSARVTATGHTDTSGPESYNMALSLRRANAVKDALVRRACRPTRSRWSARARPSRWSDRRRRARAAEPPRRDRDRWRPGGDAPRSSRIRAAYCKALSDKWREYRTSQVDTPRSGGDRQVRGGRLPGRYPDARELADRQQDPAAGARLSAGPAGPSDQAERSFLTLGKAARKGRLFHDFAQSSSRRSMNGLWPALIF